MLCLYVITANDILNLFCVQLPLNTFNSWDKDYLSLHPIYKKIGRATVVEVTRAIEFYVLTLDKN